MHKMTVAADANIRQLNPLWSPTHLLQIINNAMAECDVCAALASNA